MEAGEPRGACVYVLFALSGAAALIYQVIWTRWLGLVFGNTTLSLSIVLACFMLGLALGGRWAGARARGLRAPMRWYAAAELGLGVYALLCRPLIALADVVFVALVRADSPAAYGLLVRTVLAAALLLVPTALMGATLPLLSEFLRRERAATGSRRVGLLYAANTAGAAAGALLAGFVLIELVGTFAAAMFAAVLNFLVAWLSRRLSERAAEGPEPEPSRARGFSGAFALGIVAWSGALALASEVLWTRSLEPFIGNSTYAFSGVAVAYLCGIALGGWSLSPIVDRLDAPAPWLGGLLLGMGAWTCAAIGLCGAAAASVAGFGGRMVPLSLIFGHELLATSALLPLALMSGACFPLAVRLADPGAADASGARVADVYSWNAFGAVAGAAAGGFLIAPRWDSVNSLYVLAGLYAAGAAAAFALLAWRPDSGVRSGTAAALAVAAAAAAAFPLARARDAGRYARRYEARHPDWTVTFHRSGLQGVVTVLHNKKNSRLDGLLVNGVDMTAKATDTKMMAHLPMLLHPKPDDVLVLCLGMGTTYRSALSYGGRVTAVELVREVVDALGLFGPAADAAGPRGRVVVDDGRDFLKLTREKFDVITLDPPPPIDAAGVNSLYSREFLELVKARLKPGGIAAHWVPYPGTKGGVDDDETALMLMATFAQVFPYAYFHGSASGIGVHMIGSTAPLAFSEKSIAAKLADKAVAADVNEWDAVPPGFFSSGWVAPSARGLALPPATDDRPRLEFYLLRTWALGRRKMHPIVTW